ncbi:hypothetical protein [Sphingobacterium cellulitidis]|uniref:Uncharacterized protein n=1 Tax=Sphingobacterium cellulitidis TaxID=1768011 RepID=A0A8H9KSU6_9SPHI|nr:hypothetical protein [Sphingobacterium soli]MBA8986791.1 hypothetical protein [Sphingobacterium soli]GGE14016.1 hypothetical protein GCM10011516_09770 [Sphingobacterium soli]
MHQEVFIFITLVILIVFYSLYARKTVIRKAINEYIDYDLNEYGFELKSFEPLFLNSGEFKVNFFILLLDNLRSGIFKDTYYVNLFLLKDGKQEIITARIQSYYSFNIDNVKYSKELRKLG